MKPLSILSPINRASRYLAVFTVPCRRIPLCPAVRSFATYPVTEGVSRDSIVQWRREAEQRYQADLQERRELSNTLSPPALSINNDEGSTAANVGDAVSDPLASLPRLVEPIMPDNCCGNGCQDCVLDEYFKQYSAFAKEQHRREQLVLAAQETT